MGQYGELSHVCMLLFRAFIGTVLSRAVDEKEGVGTEQSAWIARNRKARDLHNESLIPTLGLGTPHEPLPTAKHVHWQLIPPWQKARLSHTARNVGQGDQPHGEVL